MEWRSAQLNSLQFNHGMISCAEWTGVKLSTLLEEVGVKKEARWAMVEGADGAHMNRSLPLDKCLDDCLVVYAQKRRSAAARTGLSAAAGGAGLGSNVSIKWLRRIKLDDRPWYSREETRIYRFDAGRTSRGFTWLIDANRSSPSPAGKPLNGPASTKSAGWRGRQRQSDAGRRLADGGVNWQRAQLHDPVLSKALTKFTLPWCWDGQPGCWKSAWWTRPLRAADHYAIAKRARVELGLSQQFDPDLAGEAGRERVRCSALVNRTPSP